MSHIGNHNFSISIKKLMVFVICGDKTICHRTDGICQQKASATSADCDLFDFMSWECGMTNHLRPYAFLQKLEKPYWIHRLWQNTNHATTHLLESVLQSINIISHFFVGVRLGHSRNDIMLQVGRIDHFHPCFLLLMPLANFAHKWFRSIPSPKRALPLCVEATLIIISNLTSTCIKKSVSYLFGMVQWHKYHQFSQKLALG